MRITIFIIKQFLVVAALFVVFASFAKAKVNGTCGSSANVVFTSAPTANWCSSPPGTPTSFGIESMNTSGVPTSWSWLCLGSNGGFMTFCATKAPVKIPNTAKCGTAANDPQIGVTLAAFKSKDLCTNGSFLIDQIITSSWGGFAWRCSSDPNVLTSLIDPFNWISCNTPNACGSANGQSLTTLAGMNLCASGFPISKSASSPWTWQCYQNNAPIAVNCSATAPPAVCSVVNYNSTAANPCPSGGTPSGGNCVTTSTYGATNTIDTSLKKYYITKTPSGGACKAVGFSCQSGSCPGDITLNINGSQLESFIAFTKQSYPSLLAGTGSLPSGATLIGSGIGCNSSTYNTYNFYEVVPKDCTSIVNHYAFLAKKNGTAKAYSFSCKSGSCPMDLTLGVSSPPTGSFLIGSGVGADQATINDYNFYEKSVNPCTYSCNSGDGAPVGQTCTTTSSYPQPAQLYNCSNVCSSTYSNTQRAFQSYDPNCSTASLMTWTYSLNCNCGTKALPAYTGINDSSCTACTQAGQPPAPQAGICGSANGTDVTTLAATDPGLCQNGSVDLFTGSGPWTWNCKGNWGGSSVACGATKKCIPNFNYICALIPTGTCDDTNVGKKIVAQTPACNSVGTNACSVGGIASLDECAAAGVSCPAPVEKVCQAPLSVTNWKEVAPK
jgi:hypothetical protein